MLWQHFNLGSKLLQSLTPQTDITKLILEVLAVWTLKFPNLLESCWSLSVTISWILIGNK